MSLKDWFNRETESPAATAVQEPPEQITLTTTTTIDVDTTRYVTENGDRILNGAAAAFVRDDAGVPRLLYEHLPSGAQVPFGAQVGNLTRFGELWVDLNKIVHVNLSPVDGCSAEICFQDGETVHLTAPTAAAVRAYLEGFETLRARVDEK